MTGRLALVLVVLGASACELVAGVDDRKVATTGTSTSTTTSAGTGGGTGRDAAAGGTLGSGGASASGGSGGSGGVATTGGSAGQGGAAGSGGAPATGGSGGSGGVPGDGGTGGRPDAAGDATADSGPGSGGVVGSGGSTSTGGTTQTGGTTARYDAARDLPIGLDTPSDPAGCPATGITGSGAGLLGEYFAGTAFNTLVLSRLDATVDFDWAGAPDVGLPADGFSVRWTGQVQPRFSGTYTFTTATDDGARLWVNGTLVLQDWNDHSVTENAGTIDLVAGQKYDIKLETYEAAGLAAAHLYWSSPCQPREIIPPSQLYAPATTCPGAAAGTGIGLTGDYFDNADLTGLHLSRTDPTVSFSWPASGSPDLSIAPGSYSVRWTGQVQARFSGFTTFHVTSAEGARLYVNDVPVIDDWSTHVLTQDLATIATTAGQKYNVRLDYFEQSAAGQIQLAWSGACQPREIIPQTQLYTSYAGMVCTAPPVGNGTGLRGDYYNNMDFTALAATHAGENVNFDWALAAPDPAVGADTFSVRWTGKILARYTGGTTFHTWSDDGARLWIDGQPIIDDWVDHQAAEDSGVAYLVAGQLHEIKLEFRENLENALIKLSWSSPCQAEEIIPVSQLYPPGFVPPPDAGPDAPDAGPDAPADVPADLPADSTDESEAGPSLDAGIDAT